MEIEFDKLTDDQKKCVLRYTKVHKKLTNLQSEMEDIQTRIKETIEELELIRKQEHKIFNNGKKE
jgi:septation ring formation regulator EzrA